MRVVYASAEELRALDRRIDSFWGTFSPDLRDAEARCAALDARLAFEPPDDDAGAVLRAVAPAARPLSRRVLERAPADFGYELSTFRRALTFERTVARVRERTGVDLTRARARAGFARGHLLDVAVFVPGGGGSRDEDAAAESVACLLGERVCEDFVGAVRSAPAPRGGLLRVLDSRAEERSFPLAELPLAVGAAVRGLHAGLTEEPWWAVPSEPPCVMFELEVEPAEDYARQDDAALASTCLPEMLRCYLRGERFSSVRFSKHDELFAYLKYRTRGRDLTREVERRDALEQDLDRELARARAGKVIGRAIGIAYAYLHVALCDVARSLRFMRAIAAEHDLPRESWLLFCDSELADEWIGLQPGSPEPP